MNDPYDLYTALDPRKRLRSLSHYARIIFVFGSNTEGRHGKGAALGARKYAGAVYGQARGLQGNSYAIVTKELRPSRPPVTLDQITYEVKQFLAFARARPDWAFLVSALGTGLAGFAADDIAPLFRDAPDNCFLPTAFLGPASPTAFLGPASKPRACFACGGRGYSLISVYGFPAEREVCARCDDKGVL